LLQFEPPPGGHRAALVDKDPLNSLDPLSPLSLYYTKPLTGWSCFEIDISCFAHYFLRLLGSK